MIASLRWSQLLRGIVVHPCLLVFVHSSAASSPHAFEHPDPLATQMSKSHRCLLVFRSPVTRLEKNWDQTGTGLLRTDFQLQLHAVFFATDIGGIDITQ